jgi:ubiquitin-protein ligase
VHEGPYADAILKFSLHFEMDFPKSRPVIKFGPELYHRKTLTDYVMSGIDWLAMVDPKTSIWYPRKALAEWQFVKFTTLIFE